MSRHVDYEWELKREAKRKEYLSRISATTAKHYSRYQGVVDELIDQDLEQYLPSEFTQIQSKLMRVKSSLHSAPELARDLSLELSAMVGTLPALARAAKREHITREKLRIQEEERLKKQAVSNLTAYLQSKISKITDPIERDFAFDELQKLQLNINEDDLDPSAEEALKAELDDKLVTIREVATTRAQQWITDKQRSVVSESGETIKKMFQEDLLQDASTIPGAIEAVTDRFDTFLEGINEDSVSLEDIQSAISKITEDVDSAVIDENCRREIVKALIETLNKTGFIVNTPRREISDSDTVIIHAKKPAGHQARFSVTLDGNLSYKFDQYEGMQCNKDIDQIMPMLQEIYGIELSNERILWENPDRIDRTARPIDNSTSEQSHE
jgi:hypothetical protein